MSDAYENDEFEGERYIRLTDKGKQDRDRAPVSDDPNLQRAERVIIAILEAAGDEGLPEDLLVTLAVRMDELLVQELAMAEISRRFKEELGD